MKKIKNSLYSLCVIIFSLTATNLQAQIIQSDWSLIHEENSKAKTEGNKDYKSFHQVHISIDDFKTNMPLVPQEIELPTPDGNFETFEIYPVQVVGDQVKHLYTVKTFRGIRKGDPSTLIACDISDGGFHAAVYANKQAYYVQPLDNETPDELAIFYNKDRVNSKVMCHTKTAAFKHLEKQSELVLNPAEKRTFRLAIAASSSYCDSFGGTPYSNTNILNALASGVNMINPIFLRDFGLDFSLVTNNALIFSDYYDDPFDFDDEEEALYTCHDECEYALGIEGFDIGHVIGTTETGGIASFEAVCDEYEKGAGLSDASSNLVDLWVGYVAHEVGHQLGADHNFSAAECENSVDMGRFEPGEGSSIMCYVDICEVGGPATATLPYFHYNCISSTQRFLATTTCATTNAGDNSSSPVADAKGDITIPKETPFVLVGSGADANDSAASLTYNWHQWGGGGDETNGSPDCSSLSQPLFEYFAPTTETYRSFPQYSDILAGNNDQEWEKLPCSSGAIEFSMSVRDNNASFGRTDNDLMKVTVANTGPFELTAPNGKESLEGGQNETITWTVNGTNAHCPAVDILLSIDGGTNYTVIADATSNDGSAAVLIPGAASNAARILVRCDVDGGFRSASTFYDISDNDFTIKEGVTAIHTLDDFTLSIYPNPVSDKLFIEFPETENGAFELINLEGRVMKEGEINSLNSIDVKSLPVGLYFLQLTDQYLNSITEKIIIER